MKYEFVGQSAQDSDHIAANPARLLNVYRESVGMNGRTVKVLKNVLGQDAKDDIGAFPIRAMGHGNSKNWLAGDGKLYEVADDGTVTNTATIADDANTTIAGNYTDVTVVSGSNYYVWDTSTISQPTTKTFTNVGSHCYVGGYTVITEEDGRQFQWSAQGDATSLNALHFASAEKVDDNILRAVEFSGALLLLCETSSELWQITGKGGAYEFSFVQSQNTGLKDFNLMARFDDALFFIGQDNRAYIYGGGKVSTPAVETSIKNDDPTHCFFYEDEQHKFCVIRFSDRPAWVFDMDTGEWHERSEGAGHDAWRATASLRADGEWFVGNTDGEVLQMERTSQDLNGPLYRRIVANTVLAGERRVNIPRLEIKGRVGDHDLTDAVDYVIAGDGGAAIAGDAGQAIGGDVVAAGERAAEIELYESGDGGRTWGGPYTRSMGVNGDYEQRMIWRARGQFTQYTFRLDIDEPADITLDADAYLAAS